MRDRYALIEHDQSEQLPGEAIEIINSNPGAIFEIEAYEVIGRSVDRSQRVVRQGRIDFYQGDPKGNHASRRRDKFKLYERGHSQWYDATQVFSIRMLNPDALPFWEQVDLLRRRIVTGEMLTEQKGLPQPPDAELLQAEVLNALSALAGLYRAR